MKGKSVAKGFHLDVKEGSLSRSQKTRTPSPPLLHTHTHQNTVSLPPVSGTFDSTMWQNFSFCISCCHHISLQTKFLFSLPLRITFNGLNINTLHLKGCSKVIFTWHPCSFSLLFSVSCNRKTFCWFYLSMANKLRVRNLDLLKVASLLILRPFHDFHSHHTDLCA